MCIRQIAAIYEITDVEFYNIDVDENPDLAREYRIMNIPAVIAIKGGQVAGQQIGLVSKDCLLYTSPSPRD